MRTNGQIFDLVLSIAKNDERIRAVLLNGSRANKTIEKDDLQDFDVVFLVKELDSFATNPNWIENFGERIILQTPNSMNLYENDENSIENELVYLMLFKDHNRIDLTLTKVADRNRKKDSLSKILLDKDDLFQENLNPNDKDYWMRKPSQKEFSDSCNEFWWVSTYVVKGLLRDEIIYAQDIKETILRKMFMNIITWNSAADYGFELNLSSNNRFVEKFLDSNTKDQIKSTYSDLTRENIWNSLVSMSNLFHEKSIELASTLNLNYNIEEAIGVKNYIREMRSRF